MEKLKSWLMKWGVRLASAVSVLALHGRAFAAVTVGELPPWDPGLLTLQPYLQGPLAHALTIAAIIGTFTPNECANYFSAAAYNPG